MNPIITTQKGAVAGKSLRGRKGESQNLFSTMLSERNGCCIPACNEVSVMLWTMGRTLLSTLDQETDMAARSHETPFFNPTDAQRPSRLAKPFSTLMAHTVASPSRLSSDQR